MLLLPIRIILIPRLPFTSEELAILDGPTASPFVSDVVLLRNSCRAILIGPAALYLFFFFLSFS